MKRLTSKIYTQKESLEICKELWQWLADHPVMEKQNWPGWNKYGNMSHDCPCCEYKMLHGPTRYCDSKCLIRWTGDHCESDVEEVGEYEIWKDLEDYEERTQAALKIVALCDKALHRLENRKAKKDRK